MRKGRGRDRRGFKSSFYRGLYKIIIGMNDNNPKVSFFNLPSIDNMPENHQTLKMINTINAIPTPPSMDNLDLPQQIPSLE